MIFPWEHLSNIFQDGFLLEINEVMTPISLINGFPWGEIIPISVESSAPTTYNFITDLDLLKMPTTNLPNGGFMVL